MPNVNEVIEILCDRYIKILNKHFPDNDDSEFGVAHLKWMCRQCKFNNNWPVDKKNRWIGFVQGVMAYKGYISTREEREFSRPLFHACYDNPPQTIERK